MNFVGYNEQNRRNVFSELHDTNFYSKFLPIYAFLLSGIVGIKSCLEYNTLISKCLPLFKSYNLPRTIIFRHSWQNIILTQ